MSERSHSPPDRLQAEAILGPEEHRPLPFTGRQLWLLTAITLLAGALRLWRIDAWGLWVDEAHTWRDVTLPMTGEWSFANSSVRWYPLSFLTLRWLLDLGVLQSTGEGWLRLPFAFCGTVTVPLLALFGQQFVGRRGALLAALFLAVNPWHIYWSQNARSYAFVVFWATVAGGVYWHGIERRSFWLIALAALSLLIGGLFQPSALLLLPAFLAWPFLDRFPKLANPKTWLKLMAVALLVVLLAPLLHYLPPLASFAKAKPDTSIAHLLQTTAFYFRLPLLFAAVLGVWLLFQHRLQGRALFLACWAMLPLLVLGLIGATLNKTTARYGLCALPAVILLAGGASVRMGEALRTGLSGRRAAMSWLPAWIVPIVLTMDMVSYDYLYFTSQRGDRGMWRDAAQAITAATGGRRMTVYTVNAPSMFYYLRPRHYEVAIGDPDPYPDREVRGIVNWEVARAGSGRAYLEAAIKTARSKGSELFVVVTMPELKEIEDQTHQLGAPLGDQSLRATLAERFEISGTFQVTVGPKDETIWLYRARE